MMLGLVLGIFVGVLPGLGGPNGVAILLPAHLHDGPDLGHRDAVLHLLGRAVRRRHHLDPVQHSW
jgi:TctA family transporter